MSSFFKTTNGLPQGTIKVDTQINQYSMALTIQLEDVAFNTSMFQYNEGPTGFSAIEMDSGLSIDSFSEQYNRLQPIHRNIVSHRTSLLVEAIQTAINHEKTEGKPYFSIDGGCWYITMPFYLEDYNCIIDKSLELAIHTSALLVQIARENYPFMDMNCLRNKYAILNDVRFLEHCSSVLNWTIGKSLRMIKG